MQWKFTLYFILFLAFSQPLAAQPDLGLFLQAGAEDAEKILDAYMEPLGRGMSASMTNGWYNTARTHRPFRFDAVIMSSFVYMPDELTTFSPASLALENISLVEPGSGKVPTLIGSEEIDSEYRYDYEGAAGTFEGPPGIGMKDKFGMQAVPVPLLQAGVGIFRNTDLKVRYSPAFTYENVRYRATGVALMHSLSQYLGENFRSKFDLSLVAGYTAGRMDYALKDVAMENIETENGMGELRSRGWTVQGVISYYVEGVTIYSGAGYYSASTDMALTGNYTIYADSGEARDNLTDPVRIGYSQQGPRITAGIQLEFAVITLHADYTFQKYNSLTIGLGILVEWKVR